MKLSKYKSLRFAVKGAKRYAGRNNLGRITVRHQGGGNKQLYRQIDWFRTKKNGIITNFEYDPNRTSFIAKVFYPNIIENESSNFNYILAPKGLKVFDNIQVIDEKKRNLLLKPGDSSILANFEAGDFIHNIENISGKGGLFARSAGTYGQILQYASTKFAKVRLPSGVIRLIPLKSKATLGILSNENHNKVIIRKAGKSRWLNKRPSVRGVAMNPVDHPHGGGQGKTKGGRPSVTPKSWPTKGQPTRSKKKHNKLILSLKKNN